ncbi:MAG: lipopolysaccharide assembly protein LapB [Candidatus Endonucleobacter sp. (ex Gigantidas childressi)]|nr:lipopolysaccharide assembly protein LapB [Candidatus Endonucleobacter sp. (ex Gigantidas childressi)]
MSDPALLVLLFFAIIIGYMLGRYYHQKNLKQHSSVISKSYFIGLNYLLNEQPDAAIDTFISALDITSDTVDTYLALGTLFCKRGEVDRSIRIHQELLARPSLTPSQSIKVQLELAKDYMSAGLFDRAEGILVDLVSHNHECKYDTLQQLLKIYEQEKEWLKAIDVAESLGRHQKLVNVETLALYYCEQAEKHLAHNKRVAAHRYIKNAFGLDKNCVRASLLLARMNYEDGRYRDAIKTLERIIKQDMKYIPLSIPLLESSYTNLQNTKGLGAHLSKCLNEKPCSTVILAMTGLLEKEQGQNDALEFLVEQLHRKPTLKGLAKLIQLQQEMGQEKHEDSFNLFRVLTKKMLDLKPIFNCSSCGFSGKKMHWQCPSCRDWGCVSPIEGIEGE